MTIEQAKSEIMQIYGALSPDKQRAIDTLVKIEPCEDAIDRAEAMTVIMMFAGNVKSDEENIYIKVSDAVQLLRELPSVNPQEPKYCDRNICIKNEYNGIGCDECEVTKSQEPKTDDMTSSHSELDIYKGCIDLMNDLLRQVYEWLEIVGIDVSEMDEDEQFATHFYTTEIVKRLFLWKTSHSGGTSQRMKLKELGITDDAVLFNFAKMVEPQESSEDTGIKLDEVIEKYTSNAEFERTHGNLQGYLEFRQLAEWLRELKMYRRYLLKAEVEPQGSEEV